MSARRFSEVAKRDPNWRRCADLTLKNALAGDINTDRKTCYEILERRVAVFYVGLYRSVREAY